MSHIRTIEEINEKIRKGTAVVLTAEQVAAMGRESSPAEVAKKVDVVTTATLATSFTMIIAAMGLFGLTLFATQRRTKEIGIRKVLGCSATQIVFSFIKTNLLYVFIAAAISTPITIVAMQKWLNNYVEKVGVGWWIFALTFAIAAVVVTLTVLAHSLRAANRNPVEALRYE